MRFCKRGKELKRNRRVFTEFLVVDLAGNPIAHFPTKEEAEDYVEHEAKGRRIVEVNLNGTTTIISNKVFNSAHQFREEE